MNAREEGVVVGEKGGKINGEHYNVIFLLAGGLQQGVDYD